MHPGVATSWEILMNTPQTMWEDVAAGDWFFGYMNLAAALELLSGYMEDGMSIVKPNNSIFRIEGAAMLNNFIAL